MYGKSLLMSAALLPSLAVAGHAEEDWPEPVKEYYTGQVLFDRLELTRTNEEENLAVWDVMAWYGGDYHRVVFASMENYAVVSFMGLAPYWFEMDNSLMVNEEGDVQFVSETEYEWQLTQTSYLQPRIELTANLTDSDKYDRQSGLSNLRVGLRYRHEISREFAPYIGVYWNGALGNTADEMKRMGQDTTETGVVLGARVWF